jgi:hypothetical protein
MAEKPTSFRFSEDEQLLMERLEKALGVSKIDVVRLALRLLARREGVEPEPPPPAPEKPRRKRGGA